MSVRRRDRQPQASPVLIEAIERDPEVMARLIETLLGSLVVADHVIHHAAVCGAEESLQLWYEGRPLWTQLRDMVSES